VLNSRVVWRFGESFSKQVSYALTYVFVVAGKEVKYASVEEASVDSRYVLAVKAARRPALLLCLTRNLIVEVS